MVGESVTCPMVPFSKEEEGRNDMGVSQGGRRERPEKEQEEAITTAAALGDFPPLTSISQISPPSTYTHL